MLKTIRLAAGLLAAIVLTGHALAASAAKANTLSRAERKAGWKLLFDGKTFEGWRLYGKTNAPIEGWTLTNGCLHLMPNCPGFDLITRDTFDNFEFAWAWRITPKGNNGIKYFVTETRPKAPGHEYQMIDETLGEPAKRSTASFYDVLPPQADKPLRPAGEWNHSRLVVQGSHVEHWLNDVMVLVYDLDSPQVREAIDQSKFKTAPGFGAKIKGHIMLTNHKDETWYRNLKIRLLPAQ